MPSSWGFHGEHHTVPTVPVLWILSELVISYSKPHSHTAPPPRFPPYCTWEYAAHARLRTASGLARFGEKRRDRSQSIPGDQSISRQSTTWFQSSRGHLKPTGIEAPCQVLACVGIKVLASRRVCAGTRSISAHAWSFGNGESFQEFMRTDCVTNKLLQGQIRLSTDPEWRFQIMSTSCTTRGVTVTSDGD